MLCTLVYRYLCSGTCCFYLQDIRSSTLKMKAANSPETIIPIYQSTQCHNPEHGNLNIHHCENLKSIKGMFIPDKDFIWISNTIILLDYFYCRKWGFLLSDTVD
jgi:hypothetical protein